MKQPGFFNVEERLGDQLEAFSQTMDFEVFHPDLEKVYPIRMEAKVGVDTLMRF